MIHFVYFGRLCNRRLGLLTEYAVVMLSLPWELVCLFCSQLSRECLRDDLSVAYHERIRGKRSIIIGRTSRPEDVRDFALDDLLRQVK